MSTWEFFSLAYFVPFVPTMMTKCGVTTHPRFGAGLSVFSPGACPIQNKFHFHQTKLVCSQAGQSRRRVYHPEEQCGCRSSCPRDSMRIMHNNCDSRQIWKFGLEQSFRQEAHWRKQRFYNYQELKKIFIQTLIQQNTDFAICLYDSCDVLLLYIIQYLHSPYEQRRKRNTSI